MQHISPVAWNKIVEAFEKISTINKNGVPTKVVEPSTITENILRTNIFDLTEYHQLEIINGVISDKIKSVKNKAQEFRDRESFALYAIERLEGGAGIAE